ncbi:MAG TPA: energy transducer TonB [Gemmatimonadaceae bacterium]|jgi:TonB family protein
MLHAFVSSPAARPGRSWLVVSTSSVVAHAAVISLAVATSGRTHTVEPSLLEKPPEQLIFIHARDFEHHAITIRKGALARAALKAAAMLVPDLTQLRIAVDASLAALPKVATADLDITPRATDPKKDFGEVNTGELLGGSVMWALSHPGRGNAYSSDVVEKVAWPERGNPKPRYPESLQRQGVEGSFVVEFVVDSTGKVDEKSLNFPSATHPMFLRAVKDALLHSRFFPAELAGMRVRQLVQQQFSFVLVR